MAILQERYFDRAEDAAAALADALAEALIDGLHARGHASLAVSGGKTPLIVFPKLAEARLDWANVHITLTDERWVDASHNDSNEKLVRDYLLTGPAAIATFTGLASGAATPLDALDEIESRLKKIPFPLDAVYLGMGEDGHIASLFPGMDLLNADGGACLAASDAHHPHPRISLGPAALLNARNIFLLLTGDRKRAVYEQAKRPGSVSALPLRLIVHQDAAPVTVFIGAPWY